MRRALLSSVLAGALLLGAGGASAAFGPTPGHVFRVWLDGRRIALAGTVANDTYPVLSPNGRWVVFARDPDPGRGAATLYVVGSDGKGLRRVASGISTAANLEGQISWSPDSTRFVVATAGAPMSLWLVEPGRPRIAIARALNVSGPAWSPDGHAIAFNARTQLEVVTPKGTTLWRARGYGLRPNGGGWSATGRLAVYNRERVTVYDELGHRKMRFAGRAFAWSADGRRLASIWSHQLEIRALSGRVLFRKRLPTLGGTGGLIWVDEHRVELCTPCGSTLNFVIVDTATGRVAKGNERYFGLVSPDRRLVAETFALPHGWGLRVTKLDGTGARVLARRPNCPDLTESDIQWLPDSRSLIYDFRCQSR